jgi:hypothetical protein
MCAFTDRIATVTEERRDNCRGRSRIDAVAEQKVTVMSGGAKTASKKVTTYMECDKLSNCHVIYS